MYYNYDVLGFFDFYLTPLYFHPIDLILSINKLDQDFLPLVFMYPFGRDYCRIKEIDMSIKSLICADIYIYLGARTL